MLEKEQGVIMKEYKINIERLNANKILVEKAFGIALKRSKEEMAKIKE